jgi:uncharacterized membrane protein (UPF0127 family)
MKTRLLSVGRLQVRVAFCETRAEELCGLEGHPGLTPDEGMGFFFETSHARMRAGRVSFPFRMVFVTPDRTVLSTTLVRPGAPERVFVGEGADLVLELHAGADVHVGDRVEFEYTNTAREAAVVSDPSALAVALAEGAARLGGFTWIPSDLQPNHEYALVRVTEMGEIFDALDLDENARLELQSATRDGGLRMLGEAAIAAGWAMRADMVTIGGEPALRLFRMKQRTRTAAPDVDVGGLREEVLTLVDQTFRSMGFAFDWGGAMWVPSERRWQVRGRYAVDRSSGTKEIVVHVPTTAAGALLKPSLISFRGRSYIPSKGSLRDLLSLGDEPDTTHAWGHPGKRRGT